MFALRCFLMKRAPFRRGCDLYCSGASNDVVGKVWMPCSTRVVLYVAENGWAWTFLSARTKVRCYTVLGECSTHQGSLEMFVLSCFGYLHALLRTFEAGGSYIE